MSRGTIRDGALVLADGSVFEGETDRRRAAGGIATGEVVFNTVLSGYQEVITDPSYAGQIITFTYPHIGNYGVNRDRRRVAAAVLPGRHRPRARPPAQQPPRRGRPRCRCSPPGRARHRRHRHPPPHAPDPRHRGDAGRVRHGEREPSCSPRRGAEPGTDGVDLVAQVTTPSAYTVDALSTDVDDARQPAADRRLRLRHQAHDRCATSPASARSRSCRRRRPRPTSSPASPTACSCRTGPATRRPCRYAGRRDPRPARRGADLRDLPRPPAARRWRSAAARSSCRSVTTAATTRSRTSPPDGSRSPARTTTSRSTPTGSLGDRPTMTHVNLNDGVCEGMQVTGEPAFSVQHHPEAGPGPHDSRLPVRPVRRVMTRRRGARLMPKRTDIHSILIIGSGPIVIGQACEFDYSGTQACRVLRRRATASSSPTRTRRRS